MSKTKNLTITALFAAIATILMYFEFPLPFMPPFLKVDISGAVILIAVLVLGTKQAIVALAIKDVIHLLSSSTGGVGQVADFIMLLSMIIALSLAVKLVKGKKGIALGLLVASIALIVVGSITNRYMLIPFYAKIIMPIEAIINACQAINPNIDSINAYILWGVVPFNLIKGVILSILTLLLHNRVGHLTVKK